MPKILVVDDDLCIRTLLRLLLEQAGHQVVLAANGAEALDKQKEYNTALVVTDIIMPLMDGLEAIRQLRRDYPQVKIIAITGARDSGRNDYLRRAAAIGAHRTFTKPFPPHALLAAIDELLTG